MIKPPKPGNEAQRLDALQRLDILDTQSEAAFDDLALIAAAVCDTPTALVSLIDAERQWFKARVGLDVSETSRDISFCGHAILQPQAVMVVPDALLDERFHDNPLVTAAPHIRFYAGAPLSDHDGLAMGTLCVLDTQPRSLDSRQIAGMQALARRASQAMQMRLASRELSLQMRERQWYEQQLEAYQQQLEDANAELTEQTRTDVLTGLPNRRAFTAALSQALERAVGNGMSLAVALLDVDHFKIINDLHGHDEGDRVLLALARMLNAQLAGNGLAARYGGEEFVLLIPEVGSDAARLQCEFIRQNVATLPLGLPITVSIGLAYYRRGDSAEQLLKRADLALYQAKGHGRDQVREG
ncbi:sensor domain-containing diguanylate cyclase [Pseudoxanthomonas dokdonensis]|uniref:Diguanylate cyclase n=1 Tax=Pseudoxanthomonas dokdonensis TaxID=344882 RepID=A0A0R0CFH8_9GAMM|nr:sensor domain-containing diguanylate cyclase [Pseudoxanthomonas dokdonensis]KRG68213.1 diguanylate cyclase [Pseudoxanthomonas dokdonensis]